MKRNHRIVSLCIVLAAAVFAGCGPANQLLVPLEIGRPPVVSPLPPGPHGTGVAIADFSFMPPDEPKAIGRDYDQVRQIIWEGDPGKLLADLIADALAEQGVPVSRLTAGDPAPDNVASVVSGTVRRFEVDIRRQNVIYVEIKATIEATVSVPGQDVSALWETSVSSNAVQQHLFPLPDDVRKTLSSAANSAADEIVRRLREKGATGNLR